jgi:hypothetical protein
MTDAQISATLNQEGLLSAKGKPFTRGMVNWIRYRYNIPAPSLKQSDELTVRQIANRFGVSPGSFITGSRVNIFPHVGLNRESHTGLLLAREKKQSFKPG